MRSTKILLIIAAIISGTFTKGQQFQLFINPFIGTVGHGHTYSGASLPFGMVQLSPDTRLDGVGRLLCLSDN